MRSARTQDLHQTIVEGVEIHTARKPSLLCCNRRTTESQHPAASPDACKHYRERRTLALYSSTPIRLNKRLPFSHSTSSSVFYEMTISHRACGSPKALLHGFSNAR